jgi:hypothetical protein
VRELQEEGRILVFLCTDQENKADILTKCHPTYKFKARVSGVVEARET